MLFTPIVRSLQHALHVAIPRAGADLTSDAGRAMDRTRRARLTIVANVVARILALATVITSSRLALADLGPARFGIWMTIAGLLLLVTMLDLGVGNGLVGPIARAAADGDRRQVTRLATRGFAVTGAIGLALGVVTIGGSMIVPLDGLFPGMPPPVLAEARRALICFSILISASPALGAAGRMLAGMQRGYLPHVGNAIASCLTIALLIMLGHTGGHSITAYILATFGLVQVSALAMALILARDGILRLAEFRSLTLSECLPLFRTGGLFFGLQLTVTFGWGLDQALVSITAGPAAVALYAVVARIYMLVSQPLYVLNAPLWPVYAEALHRGDHAFTRRTLRRSFFGTLALASATYAGVLLINPFLWQLFTGGALPIDQVLLVTLGIWAVFECTGNALATYLNGAHIVQEQLHAMLAFVVVAVPLKLLVLVKFGVAWMPLATSGCYFGAMIVFYGGLYRKKIFAPLRS